jgi:dTDP-4-dehydrorhamnose reductase
VLVTGAGGMLAHAVAETLARHGDTAFGVFRSEAGREQARARFPEGLALELGRDGGPDALEPLSEAAVAFAPDWIFHLAAWTDVDGCQADPERAQRSNARACHDMAKIARRCHARLLVISSDYVFDGRNDRPWREDDPTGPLSVYGGSKLAGEELVRDSGVEHVIVRTAWLFGAAGRNFVDTIRTRLEAGQPVRVVDDQWGCPTLTSDLAEALHTLAAREARGTFHVVNAGQASWYELALRIGQLLERESLVGTTTTAALGRPAPRPRYSVLDSSRYAAFAGAPLPHWHDALRRHLGVPAVA